MHPRASMSFRIHRLFVICAAFSLLAVACSKKSDPPEPQVLPGDEPGSTVRSDDPRRVDTRPPPMAQPVPLWEGGKTERDVDAATASLHGHVVLDLSDGWTPYLFSLPPETVADADPGPVQAGDEVGEEADDAPDEEADDGTLAEGPGAPTYRTTYLALANNQFPDDHHGERAQRDKYLELYGIMPTLTVLRERFRKVTALDCADGLDLAPLHSYEGFIAYRSNERARWVASHHGFLGRHVDRMIKEQGVAGMDALDPDALDRRDRERLREFKELDPDIHAIRAAQSRLECEGYMKGKGRYVRGGLDWATHEALAEFERRHRIYGWGFIGKGTLQALRKPPAELEREAVVRVLTERAMHAAGVIEDGSTSFLREDEPRTYKGADGKKHPIPNLEEKLREAIVAAFGLDTPERTLAWLESLGELPKEDARYVAFRGPELPEYYDGDMDLSVEIDRGDVWYEFPYDENGKERSQPVQRRPKLTIYTRYLDQRIPLARMGTTIGGWRSETVDGTVMWKYKESPIGERIWHQIVAAPVWMPPNTTPAHELLKRKPGGEGKEKYYINYHETGPSYASAYGLVAAYHIKYLKRGDGTYRMGGDEGIRSHGSVDYMSIMRRNSHGCHRLHNHMAVRLMSFVLAHRPHRRVGQQRISYRLPLKRDGHDYLMALDEGGYVFQLERPVHVNVLEGRVRGDLKNPIRHAIPKYDSELEAYVAPDAGPVKVKPNGKMVPYELPKPDAGVEQPPDEPGLLIPWEGGEAKPITSSNKPTEGAGGEAPAKPKQKADPSSTALTNTAPSQQ
jgi:hypothetical protein